MKIIFVIIEPSASSAAANVVFISDNKEEADLELIRLRSQFPEIDYLLLNVESNN